MRLPFKKIAKGHTSMLAEFIDPSKPVTKNLCKKHKWKEGKYYWTCSWCGLDKEKN